MSKLRFVIYILYTGLILYLVFSAAGNYGRQVHHFALVERINLIPFKDKMPYLKMDTDLHSNDWYFFLREVVGNLLLLFPIPFFLILSEGKKDFKKIMFSCFLISLFIEIAQLLLNKGQADIDDLILNTVGALIGTVLARFIEMWAGKRRKVSHIIDVS